MGADFVITRGCIVHYDEVEGFVCGDWQGLITHQVRGDVCEIISLDSQTQGAGVGTQLIQEVVSEAKRRGCRRLFLITTNDNLNALRFYQKRGFELAALYRGAVNESRKSKPSISVIGKNDIPLRDELELEMVLPGSQSRLDPPTESAPTLS